MVTKKSFYDSATERLMKQVRSMALPADFETRYDLSEMVLRFREAFKDPIIREQVLSHKYEASRLKEERFSAGFCGIASYTWNHLFRMPDRSEIWRLKQYSNNKNIYGLVNHVWLENVFDGSILDLSFDQSIDSQGKIVEIPYSLGQYADSHFNFQRAFNFASHINVDLEEIVFINNLFNQRN